MMTISPIPIIQSEFFDQRYGEDHPGVVFAGPDQGATLSRYGSTCTVKLRGEQTGGAVTLLTVVVPPGGESPSHVHSQDEIAIVQEGVLRIEAGEQTLTAGPSSCVFLPRGITHRFQNTTSIPAKLLVAFTPALPATELPETE
jgi:quercetin dioxygenase-like cupin family protein